jgi:hypothetical protein
VVGGWCITCRRGGSNRKCDASCWVKKQQCIIKGGRDYWRSDASCESMQQGRDSGWGSRRWGWCTIPLNDRMCHFMHHSPMLTSIRSCIRLTGSAGQKYVVFARRTVMTHVQTWKDGGNQTEYSEVCLWKYKVFYT